MNRPADIYFRFLQLASAVRGLPSLPSLDPLEERILNAIAGINRTGERLSVTELIACAEFGSPATVHARLKRMRGKGWLALADTQDARRKQVELTPQALAYFDALSDALRKAAAG